MWGSRSTSDSEGASSINTMAVVRRLRDHREKGRPKPSPLVTDKPASASSSNDLWEAKRDDNIGPVNKSLKINFKRNVYINSADIIVALQEVPGILKSKESRIQIKTTIRRVKKMIQLLICHPRVKHTKAYYVGRVILRELRGASKAAQAGAMKEISSKIFRAVSFAGELEERHVYWG